MFGYWANQSIGGGGSTPPPSSYVDMNQFYSWDLDELRQKCTNDYIDDDTGPDIVMGTTDDSYPNMISGRDAGIEKIRWLHCTHTGTDAKLECVFGLPLDSSGNIVTSNKFQSDAENPSFSPDWYDENKSWFDPWCNHLIGVFKLFDFDISEYASGIIMKLNTRYASMGVSGKSGPWKIPWDFTPGFGQGYEDKELSPNIGWFPSAEILSETELIIRIPGAPTDGPNRVPALHSEGIWAPYGIDTNSLSARFQYIFGGNDGNLTYTCMNYGLTQTQGRYLPANIFLNMCKVVKINE